MTWIRSQGGEIRPWYSASVTGQLQSPQFGTLSYGAYPPRDAGVEVRRVFHRLRSTAIEHFNEHFKAIFGGHAQVPARGRQPTRRFALGAVLVYQPTLLHRFEHGQPLRVGLKSCLLAA